MTRILSRPVPGTALLLAVSLIATACTSGATPAPSAPSAAPPTSAASAAASAAAATPVVLPPAETTTITIGVTNNLAINQYPSQLANDIGLFQKYGLTVKVLSMEGAGAALQSLLAGQIQAALTGPGNVLSAALTDSPLIMATMESNYLAYMLMGGKDIKTGADLKGKSIAISSLGGVSHAAVVASLSQLGLKASDVIIQGIGNEASQIAAMVSGAVASAPVSTTGVPKLQALGYNVLVDLTKSGVRFGIDGLTLTKAWAAKNPNTILRIIAAQLEAQKAMFTKTPLAVTAFQAYTTVDATVAKASLDQCLAGLCNKGFGFTKDDFALNRDILATVSPAVKDVDLGVVGDMSYLNKLKDLGFNTEIGWP